jgi:hypothetical protein
MNELLRFRQAQETGFMQASPILRLMFAIDGWPKIQLTLRTDKKLCK